MNRREFLSYTTALTAATTLPINIHGQESVIKRVIPGTDEALPVVGLGAPNVFINLPEEGNALPRSLVQAMVDMGGTVMDTPAFFRPNPPVLGEILTEMGLQDKLFLTGKITVNGKQAGIDHLEKLVSNIGKDPIDLLMIHNMRQMNIHWPTLKSWKDEGRVRYIGVSRTRQETYDELEDFMKAENPDFILTGYSIADGRAEARLLPLAQDLGVAVIGAESFKAGEDGNFFNVTAGKELPEWAAEFDCESWAQFALKYVLANPVITCVVTETNKVKHVIDNMGAGYGRLPDQAMRRKMHEHFHSL